MESVKTEKNSQMGTWVFGEEADFKPGMKQRENEKL